MRGHKLFIGEKLRALREEHRLTQARFAERLGISTSYLNQLENNQRHATATVLLGLAEHFSVDIASLSRQDSDRLLATLTEVFADPLLKDRSPSSRELRLASQNSPAVAMALVSMHQALRRAHDQLAELDDTITRAGVIVQATSYEQVRDYFHFNDNYIHELDLAAESLSEQLFDASASDRDQLLMEHLRRQHKVSIGIDLADNETIRTYDPETRQLHLNRRHPASTRAFQMAHQIALLEQADTMNDIIAKAGFGNAEADKVCRIGLANYFAGALLMPYTRFQKSARELRHDLVDMADRFQTSLEQVSHRLSTLQRPGLPGVPIFFARLDRAGNITKRHSATRLQFARFGSACPLWNAHRAFESPGRIIRQLAETPDGVQYLCLACTVDKPTGGFKDPTQQYALALGCEYRFKDEFVYSDNFAGQPLENFEPIGISCRICEREHCVQRALPPLKRALTIDQNSRELMPYSLED
ncbi:helix-turn-helix domain-containing protein [Granulosicoccus sp. 3-233]|uniref:helix-turn-helix domain-containing protein n=1 Tax=Granulosicoccus sp. 3-233 TaxID=3417969 RepID=UPI003D33AC98